MIATAVMSGLFLIFTTVPRNPSSEEGCTRSMLTWNHFESS